MQRCRSCGRTRVAGERGQVTVRMQGEVAHLRGLQSCGSIWACPVCAAKIREKRAGEISRAALAHMAAGGSIYMVTLTARHRVGQRLDPLLSVVMGGFKRLISGRAWIKEREALGVVGTIRSTEVTYGGNGWHPHLHVLVFCDGTPDPVALARAIERWGRVWGAWTAKHGYDASQARGVRWEPVASGAEAAEYVAKLQDGKHVGREVARGDLKAGRLGSLVPFELLDYFRFTGDLDALDVWHEYENATFGRRAMSWSRGLRARLLPDEEELTDQEAAEQEVGGVDVCVLPREAWDAVVEHGLEVDVLEAAEQGGIDAVTALLAPYGVTAPLPAHWESSRTDVCLSGWASSVVFPACVPPETSTLRPAATAASRNRAAWCDTVPRSINSSRW